MPNDLYGFIGRVGATRTLSCKVLPAVGMSAARVTIPDVPIAEQECVVYDPSTNSLIVGPGLVMLQRRPCANPRCQNGGSFLARVDSRQITCGPACREAKRHEAPDSSSDPDADDYQTPPRFHCRASVCPVTNSTKEGIEYHEEHCPHANLV